MACSLWIPALALALLAATAQAQSPASFPGAEGFGATATGGRGGQVIYVTTTAADGPGSLQWALDQPGRKYVLFRVSGLIDARIHLRGGDATIAGETSPGGITVRGFVTDETPFQDQAVQLPAQFAENWIMRHIRIRPGLDGPSDDGLRLRYTRNAIVDHISIGNATDEAVEISYANNISVQNCLIAETLGSHSFYGGMLMNYSNPAHGFELDKVSIHHNAFVRIEGRLPEVSRESRAAAGSTMDLEISSNLYWDPNFFIALGADTGVVTGSRGNPFPVYFRLNALNNAFRTRSLFPYGMWDDQILRSNISAPRNVIHASGNAMDLYPGRGDFALFHCCDDYRELTTPDNTPRLATSRAERHGFPGITYTATSALRTRAVAQVGAFPRDPMDVRLLAPLSENRIVESARNLNPANDALLNAYSGAAPAAPIDADNDGMPDAWEREKGLNPAWQDHNGTGLSDRGYTNLEVYLHERAQSVIGVAPPPSQPLLPPDPLDLGRRTTVALDFSRSNHGFTAGFADMPRGYDAGIYDLSSGWRARPLALRGKKALYSSGHNRSDDLFMFWKRRVTGLRPNTTYRVRASLELVSQYRGGTPGIGGSPADSVFVKFGAAPNEPVVADDGQGLLALNLDKGFQAQGGRDATVLGTVALPERGSAPYGYVRRNNYAAAGQLATTDGSGSLWIFFGTDSGFEGRTELWFTRLTAKFIRQ